jgi:hypothetical protein
MSLSMNEKSTLAVEVSHVSNFGVWLLTHNKELFMPYEDFPWFKNQTVNAITNVPTASNLSLLPHSSSQLVHGWLSRSLSLLDTASKD